MNINMQWLQAHIGGLVVEISSLHAVIQERDMVIADLRDQLVRASAPQAVEDVNRQVEIIRRNID